MSAVTYHRDELSPHVVQYLDSKRAKIRTDKSRRTYIQHLRHLASMFPGQKVEDYTEADLIQFCHSGDNPASGTIKARRSIVMGFFFWTAGAGLTPTDPSVRLKDKVDPKSRPRMRHIWLSTTQASALLDAMPTATPLQRRDRMLMFCGLYTGIRLEGLVGLRWSSFDSGLTEIQLVSKGEKLLEIAVPPELQEPLLAWYDELLANQTSPGAPLFPSFHCKMGPGAVEYVYSCDFTKPLGEQGARYVVEAAGKLIGIDHLLPHDLRRSYANMLEQTGYTIQEISRLLGHENIETTWRYMEKNPNRTKARGRSFSMRGPAAA